MLVINPDECIDCGVCVPECPVDAIISESEDPEQKWYHVNLEYSNKWPVITEKKDPLPEAEEYANITDKYDKHFSDKSGGD